MTQVIEILVIGGVGSGKSHVLGLIDRALREGYGPHVQIASRELSLERSLGSPGAEPSVDTIFSLKERQPEAGPIVSQLKIGIDSTAFDALLDKREALDRAAKLFGCESGYAGQVPTAQGLVADFAIDPLESAIESTVRLRADYPGLASVLTPHLAKLLTAQMSRLGVAESA